jgi:transposase
LALQCSEYWASRFAVDHIALTVIQAPKLEPRIMRYELTDYEWAAVRPFLPNKPRGVPRVNDRRVLNGIFWVLRSGAPWRDLPETFGPYTTCYNRFVRWGKRIRRNGGARDVLAPKGIAIFWGTGDKGIIERLKLGPVGPEEFISYKPTDPAEIALLRSAQHID